MRAFSGIVERPPASRRFPVFVPISIVFVVRIGVLRALLWLSRSFSLVLGGVLRTMTGFKRPATGCLLFLSLLLMLVLLLLSLPGWLPEMDFSFKVMAETPFTRACCCSAMGLSGLLRSMPAPRRRSSNIWRTLPLPISREEAALGDVVVVAAAGVVKWSS